VLKYFSSLSFTNKYIIALSIIAFLSFSAFFNLTKIISSQSNDGEIINISGKQRMLSQRIALFALENNKVELKQTIDFMKRSHKKLLAIKMSDRVKKVYFFNPIFLDKKVQNYIKNAEILLNSSNGDSLQYILENSQSILKDLDLIVSVYQDEAEQKIENIHKIELALLILTILILIFEAIFIFRPIDKSEKRKTKELVSEKEYSDIITQINTNAIIAVNNDFEILTFNKSAEEIFGYTAQEMLFTKLTDDKIIPSKYLMQHNTGLASFMKSGKLKNKDVVFELEGHHKNGHLFPIRISFGVKIEQNRKIVVANIQDITQEKEKDTLIIQQSRYAAMGEMIGNIAHQWRQPLSSISTIATGTKLRYKNNMIDDEELIETFDKIKLHTKYLSNTIDDFKDFFIDNKEMKIFSIKEVIDKSISLTEAIFISNNISLHVEMDEDLKASGSSSELSQVFLNILYNAKDIFLEKNIDERAVLIEVKTDEKELLICIKDSAGGISEDIKLKIFEPYFTTKHKSQGTGIGLFMSKKIIEQHYGGTLQSTNEEFSLNGKKYFGASFNIRIKLA